jgi:hypothetical protein|uniref:Uncharacterized protein n=1 Tax=Myoviridae sp. ctWb16 TaxID=2827690 RepID=A0A8S5SZZ5_9CAUD|nr:MAG TPA: hypothetical protein [Myoviridae sp. ctWb16]DAV17861.1 MAG TPA: hypothetical protein [Caudoviricetes sp.]
MKYIIELIMTDEYGNTNNEVLPCETIEEFQKSKEMFENKELKLKLYECKEIEVDGEV